MTSRQADFLARHANYGRITVGVGSWIAPAIASKAMGFYGPPDGGQAYMLRLFGVREIALGVATARCASASQANLLAVGSTIDLADTLAAILGIRSGRIAKRTGCYIGSVSAASALVSALAALSARRCGARTSQPRLPEALPGFAPTTD